MGPIAKIDKPFVSMDYTVRAGVLKIAMKGIDLNDRVMCAFLGSSLHQERGPFRGPVPSKQR